MKSGDRVRLVVPGIRGGVILDRCLNEFRIWNLKDLESERGKP